MSQNSDKNRKTKKANFKKANIPETQVVIESTNTPQTTLNTQESNIPESTPSTQGTKIPQKTFPTNPTLKDPSKINVSVLFDLANKINANLRNKSKDN